MKFATFLTSIKQNGFKPASGSTCFYSNTYPPLFFKLLFDKEKFSNFLFLDASSIPISEILPILNQRLLDQTKILWLSNLSEAPKAKQSKLLTILLKYQGPHSVLFFYENKQSKILNIQIDDVLNRSTLEILASTFFPLKAHVLNYLLQHVQHIDLNAACKLSYYINLIGKKNSTESFAYISKILTKQEHSLFELSDSFFAYNKKKFFSLWKDLSQAYPPIFWLSFWSEQIWKAHYTLTYLQEKNFLSAKKSSFRLPKSFVNKYWKNFSLKQLLNLHKKLYNIDFHIKKGSSFYSLDLFYLSHFIREKSH